MMKKGTSEKSLDNPGICSGTRDCSQRSVTTMSLLPSHAAPVLGPLGSLCTLLALLLLLTPPGPLSTGGPVAAALRELRCSCLQTTQRVQPQMISNLQVFPIGPQCSQVEVVASLRNGTEVCLDPQAPFLKKVIQKLLDGENQDN
ncbi:C-X-C motif chemokine 5-like isoform X3 [Piliocolobus tephrosceles]|uniref:C-X-C motif chemokine n=1 Tax=Piliocolobus tephrosceles TaxID=591936 RepID=A0A8C9H6C8_9PRIM|nr:C-X-C motif chemokine 5-like isoform X3 [Piliocolobus tephrosceles]